MGRTALGLVIVFATFGMACDNRDGGGGGGAASKPAGALVEVGRPLFVGTPDPRIFAGTSVDPKEALKARGPVRMPPGVAVLSRGCPVTLSDASPLIGSADLATDADKEGTDGSYVELSHGLQWAQVDLGRPAEIASIVLWHYHKEQRIYRDVVVQVADDPDFITDVRTVFNNDHDNSAGLGLGTDREYLETNEGKLIDAKNVKARYVRCYSKGSTTDANNHYIEIEVWGRR